MSRELRLPSLNKVLITGNLTADPEVRYIPSGAAVVNLRLASNRRYLDSKTNEWKDDTCFIDVVAWRELAERCGDQLRKGSPVLVEGRLQSRNWETQDGQKRTTIEILGERVQFLERRGEGAAAPAGGGGFSGRSSSSGGDDSSMGADDLPF